MRIGIFCTATNPVPPINYGGTQMVNWETANALVERGHEVYLFAPKFSRSSAKIIKIDPGWGAVNEEINVRKFLVPNADNLDIVIDTSAFSFPSRLLPSMPYVARMGGDPYKRYCRFFLKNIIWPSQHHFDFHNRGDCSCSQRRQKSIPPVIIPKPVCFRYIYQDEDCLPLHTLSVRRNLDYRKEDYFLYLGLIGEHKGAHLAAEWASRLGHRLIIAGPKDTSLYFDEKIKIHLSDKIKYLHAVPNLDKWELMAKAKAVIFPSTCEEGDPNVPKESLAVGTPVIALDGTVSEIIDDGVTGIICKDVNEMLNRWRETLYMDPIECRKRVVEKFGIKKYIDKTICALERARNGDLWL